MPKVYGATFFLSIPNYISDQSDTTITTTLHLDRFGVRTINAVRRALKNNLTAFMSDCKAGAIYKALCDEYDLIPAYMARSGDKNDNGRALHIHEAAEMHDMLQAAQALSKPEGKQWSPELYLYNDGSILTWGCSINPKVVQKMITDTRPNPIDNIARAVAHLDSGKPVDYVYTYIPAYPPLPKGRTPNA